MSHRAGLDQARVVEAAAMLVDKKGIEHLTLGHLAEQLGVRTPSLYNHVAGLPGLKRELQLYYLHDLLNYITRSAIGKARDEAIFSIAHAYRIYARESPGRYALTLQAPDPNDQELLTIAGQVVTVLQAVLAPYNLDEAASIHAIRGLRSIVQGFISLETGGGFAMPVDLDASFHWLITVYIAGLQELAK